MSRDCSESRGILSPENLSLVYRTVSFIPLFTMMLWLAALLFLPHIASAETSAVLPELDDIAGLTL